MGTTKKELVLDLQRKPQSLVRDRLIGRALAGFYHDFDSNLPGPKITLIAELRSAGYADLEQNVMNGDYDDEAPTLEQVEELRNELGPEVFDELMGDKGRGKA